MTFNKHSFLNDLLSQIRLADALDVGIISVLLYVIFIWLHDRASRSLGLTLIMLTGAFLLSRWLDLFLTTMVFRYGFIGILLALVVIFQHDIRHGFERLASSHWFSRQARDAMARDTLEIVAEAVITMAHKRVGALIVFPGREPLDRHLHGGVTVDAHISIPLLLSIFHPKSPGHDGALLIERNRIVSLGLHLPLSTHWKKIKDVGTRHAAALGLAECCDATVVVVSEERGTISIARDGELTVIDSMRVSEYLQQYLNEHRDVGQRSLKSPLIDWCMKVSAVIASLSLWFLFAYHTDTVQRTFIVPIEYRNLPAKYEIEEPKSTYAEVTLSGSEKAFAMLEPSTIAVSLKIDGGNYSRLLRWPTAANLTKIPAELKIEQVIPDAIVVSLRNKATE